MKRNSYAPFGDVFAPTVIDGTGYTGHVMDQATGLTYMQQRYYDPAIGRFLSIDPVSTDSNTGASFSRYNYANNSPYKFTDPDGRFGIVGAGIGFGIEFATQMMSAEGSFTERLAQCDVTDLLVATAVGAVTGGVGGQLASKAAQGSIRTAMAIKETAKAGGAASALGAGAKDVANGRAPDGGKMVISGVIGTVASGSGAKVGTATAAKFQAMAMSNLPGQANIAAATTGVMRLPEISTSAAQSAGQLAIDAAGSSVDSAAQQRREKP